MFAQCPGNSDEFDPTTMFRRILIPVDFSPESRRALITACETRRRFGSEIRLLVVRETGERGESLTGFDTPRTRKTIEESSCDELRFLAESVCNGTPCTTLEVARGHDVVSGIAEAVRRCGATVVFLPYHPKKSLLRSRAEKIVQTLDVPVFIVKDDEAATVHQGEAPRKKVKPCAERPVILSPAGRLIANPRWPTPCHLCTPVE